MSDQIDADTVRALFERVEEHERVIEGVFANSKLVTEQVVKLGMQVQNLADEIRMQREQTPEMMMQSAIAIVGNPKFWEAARSAWAMQARNAAGGWLLGWIGSIFTRPLHLLLFLLMLYQFGGLHAVMDWIKSHLGS